MKYQNLIFILISFFIFSLSSDGKIKKQQKDAKIFVKILTSKEGILDIHNSIDTLNFELMNLLNSMNNEKNFMSLFKEFSSTLSNIQCGHTQLFPSKKLIKEWVGNKKCLPFDYYLVGKKLFVNKLEKEDEKIVNTGKEINQQATIVENSEIISIDGKSVPELMQEIGKYISSDENGEDLKYYYAGQFFELYRNLSFENDKDSIQVIYSVKKDTSYRYIYLGLPPVKTINKRIQDNSKESSEKTKDFGKFSILKNKYGYFKFTSFKNSGGKKYTEFLEKSFKDLKDKKIEKLIVDLRGNLGGRMQFQFLNYIVGQRVYLGKYIVNKPFRMFKNRHVKKGNAEFVNHFLLSKMQGLSKKLNKQFDGKIYSPSSDNPNRFIGDIVVITDGGTFSAASILAGHLKSLAKAKIAGMPAGGSFYMGNAGTLKVILPYTKFQLFVNPNTFWSQLANVENPQLIKQPDLFLEPINPKQKKKDEWYINKVLKIFK